MRAHDLNLAIVLLLESLLDFWFVGDLWSVISALFFKVPVIWVGQCGFLDMKLLVRVFIFVFFFPYLMGLLW